MGNLLAHFRENRRAILRNPLTWVLVVLFLVPGISAVERMVTDGSVDIDGLINGGAYVIGGMSPYEEPAVRRYPPAFSVLMVPLAVLPIWLAGIVWYIVQFASLAGVLMLSWRLGGEKQPRTKRLVVAGAAVIAWTWAHLVMNQITGVALYLGLAGAAMALGRARMQFVGGLLIGLGVVVKLFPGIFLVPLLLTRRWIPCTGFAAALVASVLLVVAIYGVDGSVELHRRWIHDAASTSGAAAFLEEGRSTRYNNQSLLVNVLRVFKADVNAGRSKKPLYVNVADLSPAAIDMIVRGVQLASLALLVVVVLKSNRAGLAEFAIASAMTVYFLPVAWTFHFVTLIPACVAMACADDRKSRVLLGACALAQLSLVSGHLRAIGVPMLATVPAILGAARLAWLAPRERAAAA